MTLKLYKTKASRNVLTKKLTNEHAITFNIKDSTDLREPVLRLDVTGLNILNYNYAYIEEFNRYYFIDKNNITFISGHIVDIKLETDVLMTHRDGILNTIALIIRQEKKVQKYIIDRNKPQYAYKNIVTKTFPNEITNSDFSYVLITA